MNLFDIIQSISIWGDTLEPKIKTINTYKHWVSIEDFKRCFICALNHGKIYLIHEQPNPEPPIHHNCRCSIHPMKSILAGTATIKDSNGADWHLKHNNKLPNYYISKNEALNQGWRPGKWPSNFIENQSIGGGCIQQR